MKSVSVWEVASNLLVYMRGRWVLCVVLQTNAAQILNDIPYNLPLCGGSVATVVVAQHTSHPL